MSQSSDYPDDKPETIGRYELKRVIGRGSFGEVYFAHDPQLDRPVAVKILRAGAGATDAQIDSFLQEARRVARLQHPGIVIIHDVGVHEGPGYLVSGFIYGGGLGEWEDCGRPGA